MIPVSNYHSKYSCVMSFYLLRLNNLLHLELMLLSKLVTRLETISEKYEITTNNTRQLG